MPNGPVMNGVGGYEKIKEYGGFINEGQLLEIGKEHYILLAYLSTFKHSGLILDIGTNFGYSAYFLSYNPKNIIYSFDISKKERHWKIDGKENINFFVRNIINDDIHMFNDIFLSCFLIFLDIDSQEGLDEYSLYKHLKKIEFNGILLCDDIHYFIGMKNNFWDLIPDKEKIDITCLGHWTGTGLISFNPELMNDIKRYLFV